jgi:A/G-specific adenine glycosylase
MNPLSETLVRWYRKHRILYPWRRTREPYAVWVSEILLQQTRISVVIPFYEKIVARFPTVSALAATDPAEFLALWSGIGYYRRAEHMLRCAREIEQAHGGQFPSELSALLALPGIGKYTAGALSNLCFGRLAPAIDGNIARVLARISNCSARYGSKDFHNRIEDVFLHYGEGAPAADYFQSLMELGERICLPAPDCPSCPVRGHCAAYLNGNQASIPRMPAKRKQTAFHWYFLMLRRGNRHLYVQNPNREFLKSVWLFPDVLSKSKMNEPGLRNEFQKKWGIDAKRLTEVASVKHAVTFRKITGHILITQWNGKLPAGGRWFNENELRLQHTSSVVHKILKALEATSCAVYRKSFRSNAGTIRGRSRLD